MASETVPAGTAPATPATVTPNPLLPLAERVYDLAALLSCVADRVADVHGQMEGDHEESLWHALRAIRHCQRMADDIGGDVEEACHV